MFLDNAILSKIKKRGLYYNKYQNPKNRLEFRNYYSYLTVSSIIDSIIEINQKKIEFYNNIPFVLYMDLIKFINPLILNHNDKSLINDNIISKYNSNFTNINFFKKLSKISNLLLAQSFKKKFKIGITGGLTFDYFLLKKKLSYHDIDFYVLKKDIKNYKFKNKYDQIDIIINNLSNTFRSFNLKKIITDDLLSKITQYIGSQINELQCNYPEIKNNTKLLLTGCVANGMPRQALFLAYKNKIQTLTLHHGAQYQIFDEPWMDLYEENIIQGKIAYGSMKENLPKFSNNVFNKKINYFSRVDNDVLSIFDNSAIKNINFKKNIKIAYFSICFGNNFYGLERDIDIKSYFKWQKYMTNFFINNITEKFHIKDHPKKVYVNNEIISIPPIKIKSLKKIILNYDLFIIDYPTSSLAKLATSNKNIIFFDLGLRNIDSYASSLIKKRCHTIKVDPYNPKITQSQIYNISSSAFTNDFSKHYTLNNNLISEEESIANILINYISKNNL